MHQILLYHLKLKLYLIDKHPFSVQYFLQKFFLDKRLCFHDLKHFLSFDDLLEMPDHIMKVFWRNPEIDVDDLSKALKGQEQSIIENISSYLSKRNQRKFTEFTDPLSKRDIDSSQLSFVNLARKMNDAKEIKLEDILEETDLIELGFSFLSLKLDLQALLHLKH